MSTKRSILIINDFDFINGGGSQVAISSANYLQALGFSVIFFSAVSDPGKNDLEPGIRKISTSQYDILNNPSRIQAMRDGIWNRRAARLLGALLEELDPKETVVHIHSWTKALSASIGKTLAGSHFPTIISLHDYFIACPNGGFYNYQTKELCHLKPLSAACIKTHCDARSYSQKLWRVSRQIVQENLGKIPSGIGNFITVSRFSETIMRPFLPDKAKIFRLPNPVFNANIEHAPTRDPSLPLLYVGRLSAEKGVLLACEAARRIGKKLKVIGDGQQRHTILEQYPEVDYRGWLNAKDVNQEMLNSSVLIFPSLCYETQGMTVLEAISTGLPVVVSKDTASTEYVNITNGVLYERNNVDDLKDKILRVLSNMSHYSKGAIPKESAPLPVTSYISELAKIYRNL